MRKLTIILFTIIISQNIFSQNNDTTSTKKYIFPIEINVEANYTNETGYGASILSNIVSKNNNSFIIGIKYAQYNFHFNHLQANSITVDNRTYYDINDNISVIEIPFFYRYVHESDIFLNIGIAYGLNFNNKFRSEYYKSVGGTFYEKTESNNSDTKSYGNIIGGIGFQKLYTNYGYNISFNFMLNSLSLNTNNQDYYYEGVPNLSNFSLSVGFIIK